MEIRRGDLVTATISGDYGKPRPALIVQADEFGKLESVTLLPLTSDLQDWGLFRITVEPSRENGLRLRSQVMIDKATTVRRARIGRRIGILEGSVMRTVNDALSRFLAVD